MSDPKKSRTWNLRLNLDEFNAICGMAFTEADRSALLGGLQLGCNEGTLPEHCSNIVRTAYEIGMGWRQEAEGYQKRKSDAGHKSAEARKAKYGTSMPNTARTPLEQCPNQSTIHNPQSTNEQSDNPKKKRKSLEDVLTPYDSSTKELAQKILSIWPTPSKAKQPDGSPVPHINAPTLAYRLEEIVRKYKADPEILFLVAQRHVTAFKEERSFYLKAPQSLFGPGVGDKRDPWREIYRAILSNREDQAKQEIQDASHQ